MKKSAAAAGFTLIEILVVLVVLAAVVGLVALSIVPDDRDALREETRRLALLFEHARDEAISTGHSIAWMPDGARYAFRRRDDARRWVEPAGDETFATRTLAPAVAFADLEVQGHVPAQHPGLVFSSSGLNSPFRLVLGASDYRMSILGDAAGRIRIHDTP